jgi:DNA-binding response OmpR family regulator
MTAPSGTDPFAIAPARLPGAEPRGSLVPDVRVNRMQRPLVLVVEPNLDMSRFISSSLSGQYRVAEACNGSDGVEKARTLKPDLILADTVLLQTTASDLVRALRQVSELDSTPVMLLIAADEERQTRLPVEHAEDYLTKPFEPDELRTRVKHLLAMKVARDALLQSETRFQTLFEQTSDGIFIGEAEDGRCAAVFCAMNT